MKLQIDVFNYRHIWTKSIYIVFDDVTKLVAYLNELTRDTDDTYIIHNGDNSKSRPIKGGENNEI